MKITYLTYFPFIFLLVLCSCKDDRANEVPAPLEPVGILQINLQHFFHSNPLLLESMYEIESGDSVSVSSLDYIVSNIRLVSENGEIWDAENDAFIIDVTDVNSHELIIKNVAVNHYVYMTMTVGLQPSDFMNDTLFNSNYSSTQIDKVRNTTTLAYQFLHLTGNYSSNMGVKQSLDVLNENSGNFATYQLGEFPTSSARTLHVPITNFKLDIEANTTTQLGLKIIVSNLFEEVTPIDFDNNQHTSNLNSLCFKNYNHYFIDLDN